jgi:hypothetical protein
MVPERQGKVDKTTVLESFVSFPSCEKMLELLDLETSQNGSTS